jgi:hypothetical protein
LTHGELLSIFWPLSWVPQPGAGENKTIKEFYVREIFVRPVGKSLTPGLSKIHRKRKAGLSKK